MQKFDAIIFWCEFPEKIPLRRMRLIDFPCEVYVAAKDRKEYVFWGKKVKQKNVRVGVWPTLSFHEGYWFSKYITREAIDKLKEFDGIDVKIDIEPPIPYTSSLFQRFSLIRLIRDCMRGTWGMKERNKAYLWSVIRGLKSKKIFVSGFPLPNILSKSYGDDMKEMHPRFFRNYFLYSTFFKNCVLRELVMWYYKWFVKIRKKQHAKDKLYFAIGCVGTGVFSTEPVYGNVVDFERDLDRFLEWGVRNLVVFNLEGVLEKKDAEAWMNALKKRCTAFSVGSGV